MLLFGIQNIVYPQSPRFNFNFKDVYIKHVFSEIESKSNYIFLYSDKQINIYKRVSVSVKDATIDELLKEVFKDKVTYLIEDRQIIIKSSELDDSKKYRFSGRVIDEEGKPIYGVNVLVKGGTDGIATDNEGYFLLETDEEETQLSFTFIGFKPQEKKAYFKSFTEIVLEEETSELGEVVVVGYGSQKRASVIGSIDRVNPGELQQPSRTLSTSLAGRLAGIIAVQKSGEPGYDGADFWIRGVNTFTGDTNPLILVDGVERNIDNIDTEEISEFTILKDATATAVYGVRGANGVVLITTKHGRIGKPQINFRSENGYSSPLSLPKFVDGATYMELQNEALQNSGLTPIFSNNQIEHTRKGTDPYYYPDVNWMDEFIKPWSSSHRVTLNVSGGTPKARYFVSGAFFNQNGMWKKYEENSYNNNVNLKRYNFRTNIDIDVTPTTILSLKIGAILEDRNYPGVSSSQIFTYMMDVPPTWFPLKYQDKDKIPGISYNQGRNPYQLLAHSGYSTHFYTTLQSNISVNQNLGFILEGLKTNVMFAFDTYTSANILRELAPRPYLIKPWGFDSKGEPILANSNGDYRYIEQDQSNDSYHDYLVRNNSSSKSFTTTQRSVYIEASVMYNKTFNEHGLGALLLYNQSDKLYPSKTGIFDAIPKRHQGLTGRLTYEYREKYFFEFNFGYNGSENYKKGNRYGFFPSYAVGWTPSNEDFFYPVKRYIEYMKIRASHGIVGNDRTDNRFAYITRVDYTNTNVGFGTNNGYGYGSGRGIDIVYYGNADAVWEEASKTDIGIELKFLKHFRLQSDFFYEKRKNIWTELSKVPDIVGFGDRIPYSSIGVMQNMGVDGFLEYGQLFSKDFSMSFKGTYSFARNEVLKNGMAKPKYSYQSHIGQPYGRSLGYIAEGLFIDQSEIDNSPDQSSLGNTKPGDIKYRDINDDDKIDDFDRLFIGYSWVPEITFGLGATFKFRSLDFAFLLQGATNVSFFAKPKIFPEVNKGNVLSIVEKSRWNSNTQNLNADFPRLGVGNQNNNYVNSTWWLKDGSYVRLKQIELGYSLPEKLIGRYHMTNVRFYTNALNIMTFSGFKWWDSESQDIDGMYYPPQKVVNFGVEVKF